MLSEEGEQCGIGWGLWASHGSHTRNALPGTEEKGHE